MQALHPLVKPVRVGILVVDFPDGAAWTGVEVPVLTAEFHLQRGKGHNVDQQYLGKRSKIHCRPTD